MEVHKRAGNVRYKHPGEQSTGNNKVLNSTKVFKLQSHLGNIDQLEQVS